MNVDRIREVVSVLRQEADGNRAQFGLYREAHEEDVFVRATTDGVLLFAAEVLEGSVKAQAPVGSSLIALDTDTDFHDQHADLHLHAIELYGDDLAPPRKRKLRVTKWEYAAVMGCLVTLVLTTICALFGAYFIGRWLYQSILMG